MALTDLTLSDGSTAKVEPAFVVAIVPTPNAAAQSRTVVHFYGGLQLTTNGSVADAQTELGL